MMFTPLHAIVFGWLTYDPLALPEEIAAIVDVPEPLVLAICRDLKSTGLGR